MALFKNFKAVLVLLLSAAFVAVGVQNLSERLGFRLFYDGVVWVKGESGLEVERVEEPVFRSADGIVPAPGDRLISINQIEISDHLEYEVVTQYLESLPEGQRVEMLIRRASSGQEAVLAGAIQLRSQALGINAALALAALAFLLVGCFIYLRNWRAAGAFHFYLICLAGFIVLFYSHSGSGSLLDSVVYWFETLAWLLLPALLLHFSCYFPRTLPLLQSQPLFAGLIYLPAAFFAVLHALWFEGFQPFGLAAAPESALLLDRVYMVYLVAFFLLSAVALFQVQRNLASVAEKSQLKWITQGVLWGTLPFAVFYVLPVAAGFHATGLQQLSVLPLALIPLGFGYAITRYRLMDVDVIFKQGLAYALTSSALLGLYVVVAALLGRAVQSVWPGSGFGVFALAALFMAFLFSPLKERIQSQIDRHFYKDQYNYRASFSEFGRALGSEIQLPELNQSISMRIQSALDVSTVAVYLRDEADADLYHCIQCVTPEQSGQAQAVRFPRELLAATGPIQINRAGAEWESQEQEADSFQEQGIEYIQPLSVRGRTIGFVGMGRKSNGEPLSSEDLYLVSTLAGYAAIAIDNALLYDSLESKATQLSRLKAYNENVIESITVGVAVVDEEGTVRVWNSAMESLYGLARSEAVGKHLESLLPSELTSAMKRLLEGSRWSVQATRHLYKTHLRNHQQRELLANVTMTPFVGRSQADAGLLILFEDITEKSQLESQLLQAEKLSSIGLFAAGVAHEVNTPLAGISSYAQMLLQQTSADNPHYEMLRKIELQSVRASRMVNNLLNFARVTDSELAEVNLNNMMVDTVSLLEHQFKRSRVDVHVDLDPYLPKTLGMGGKLQQVFMNLFLNAKDAMPEGGRLDIKTALQDGKAVIQVRDSGTGIAPQDIQKIYDPFFTTKDVGKGTGLGLSVSYGIIQDHAGQIDVRSQPGRGTAFTVQIPIKRLQ